MTYIFKQPATYGGTLVPTPASKLTTATSGGAGSPPAPTTLTPAATVTPKQSPGPVIAPAVPATSIYTYKATITAYNPTTKIATLSTPVNISIGTNQFYGLLDSHYSINGVAPGTGVGAVKNMAQALYLGNNIPQLSSTEDGNFIGIFNVPSSIFQAGQRVFRLDNRTVSTDPTTATTFAQAVFTASALTNKASATDFSPSVDSSTTTFTQTSQQSSQVVNTISSTSPYDPLAQSFMVSKDNYPNGVFLYSIKLFFATVPATGSHPITLSIVNTLNGYPNGQVLDYSTVVMNGNNVKTSTTPHYLDPTTYTEFVFDAPVYIQPGVLYAMLLQSNSPEYTLYYAQQNGIAIPSTAKPLPTSANPSNPTKIGTAPYIGALFESQNSITWTADQTSDLMFVLNQCVFNTAVNPQIQFVIPQRLPYRKLGYNDVTFAFDANSVSNLYGNYSNDMLIDAINVTTTDFVPTQTNISYNYQALINSTQSYSPVSQINPGKFGTPTPSNISFADGLGERLLASGSQSAFTVNATLVSNDPNVSPIISDDGLTVYTIDYTINNMGISNSNITIVSGGTGYNVNTAVVTLITPDSGASGATFGLTANNGVITSVYVINSGTGYVSTPTITITDPTTRSGNANAVITIAGETSVSGGNAYCRYFTKKAILTPGNDSGDLRVYLDAYRPVGTNIYVYYKILSSSDASVFETGTWQLMTLINNPNSYSSALTDVIEYEFAPGTNNVANNNISYTNAQGQTFTSFIQYAIKIVLATSDNTNVPIINDIRALALPPGTGI